MVVELGFVLVDWLGVVVVDCDGVTPVAEGVVCVADGLPTVPAPPGAVAVVPVVPMLPGVPVVCAAATPIARVSTNDAHIAFFIRCRSFCGLIGPEFVMLATCISKLGCHVLQAGMAQVGRDGLFPVQCSTSQTASC